MRVVEAQEIVAVAYRLATQKAVRCVAGIGVVMFGITTFVQHRWVFGVCALLLSCAAGLLMSKDARRRVTRITGLSDMAQEGVWTRFRRDRSYAMRVKVAIANDGLPRALDEITRSLNSELTSKKAQEILQGLE